MRKKRHTEEEGLQPSTENKKESIKTKSKSKSNNL